MNRTLPINKILKWPNYPCIIVPTHMEIGNQREGTIIHYRRAAALAGIHLIAAWKVKAYGLSSFPGKSSNRLLTLESGQRRRSRRRSMKTMMRSHSTHVVKGMNIT